MPLDNIVDVWEREHRRAFRWAMFYLFASLMMLGASTGFALHLGFIQAGVPQKLACLFGSFLAAALACFFGTMRGSKLVVQGEYEFLLRNHREGYG